MKIIFYAKRCINITKIQFLYISIVLNIYPLTVYMSYDLKPLFGMFFRLIISLYNKQITPIFKRIL